MTQLMTTIYYKDGKQITVPADTIFSIIGRRPWRPPAPPKPLAYLKPDYKGKNISGGRKCVFSQSKAYKGNNLPGHARAWAWPYARDNELTKER